MEHQAALLLKYHVVLHGCVAAGSMGVPQSLGLVTNDAGEQLVYGDTKGSVLMLLCGTREWPARDMISTDEHQDYICIHAEHTDWVTQVRVQGHGQGGCMPARTACGRVHGGMQALRFQKGPCQGPSRNEARPWSCTCTWGCAAALAVPCLLR